MCPLCAMAQKMHGNRYGVHPHQGTLSYCVTWNDTRLPTDKHGRGCLWAMESIVVLY